MTKPFLHLIFFCLIFINLCIYGKSKDDAPICKICLQVLIGEYSLDAWGNPFHIHHEEEGIFCHSCSRIISQGITQGGFRYKDDRYICSLCQITVVEDSLVIHTAFTSVMKQFKAVGIHNIPGDIPIELVNLNRLNDIYRKQSHGNLKGFTHTKHDHKSKPSYTIFMLFGLPLIEFKSVLAHELLHIWLQENNFRLTLEETEGFCNLGSALIYENDGTHFAIIHLKAMDNDPHIIYGDGYRKMKAMLEKLGWNNLLSNINSFE